MIIEVKQEHIDRGVPKSNCICPIALAIRDKGKSHVSVGPITIAVQGRLVHTPRVAMEFIRAFDYGNPVEPFSFEIDFNQEPSSA